MFALSNLHEMLWMTNFYRDQIHKKRFFFPFYFPKKKILVRKLKTRSWALVSNNVILVDLRRKPNKLMLSGPFLVQVSDIVKAPHTNMEFHLIIRGLNATRNTMITLIKDAIIRDEYLFDNWMIEHHKESLDKFDRWRHKRWWISVW